MTRFRLQAITIGVTLLPALGLGFRFASEGPGPNPVDDLTHVTGEWGLRFLILSLAVTPARHFFGWHWAQPLRRTLGLAAFFYALAHLASHHTSHLRGRYSWCSYYVCFLLSFCCVFRLCFVFFPFLSITSFCDVDAYLLFLCSFFAHVLCLLVVFLLLPSCASAVCSV